MGCEGCGQKVATTRLRVLSLTAPPTPSRAQVLPWEQRRLIGTWRAWWRTLGLSLRDPGRIARQMPEDSRFGASYLFAASCYVVAAGLNVLLLLAIGTVSLLGSNRAPLPPGFAAGELVMLITVVLAVLVASCLAPLAVQLVMTLPAHVCSWALELRRAELKRTARLMNFAQGPVALLGVPLMGWCCCSRQ